MICLVVCGELTWISHISQKNSFHPSSDGSISVSNFYFFTSQLPYKLMNYCIQWQHDWIPCICRRYMLCELWSQRSQFVFFDMNINYDNVTTLGDFDQIDCHRRRNFLSSCRMEDYGIILVVFCVIVIILTSKVELK